MLRLLLQTHHRRQGHETLFTALRHLGAAGLFFLAILDSSPIPTFAGPDILTAILAASHRPLWYEYAAAATSGSVLGAYLTFRLARRAGSAYLESKFKRGRLSQLLHLFRRWGTGTLVASAAIPLPSPTSLFFAAAGASEYPSRRFITVVAVARGARYFGIAFIAGHYGRHFLRVLRHPMQHWGWLLLCIGLTGALIVAGIVMSRRLEHVPHAEVTR
ncbi:MAG TPA: VTT domain-containing protein [Candidatus Sulfotelmatobacter sp.]|nr:VTT domain-containing protein [Candidatus Sulfotelmatobacter sp.]